MIARFLPMTILAVLVGCKGCKDKATETGVNLDDSGDTGDPGSDADGDGVPASEDCDDGDPTVGAGATWYQDEDGDGYGGATNTTTACDQPEGYGAASDDCDDADDRIHPGATEDDCLDPTDYNCDGSTGYADLDGDGVAACQDCDDGNPAANPGELEVCDGVDNDCDSAIDEDVADAATWYTDGDGDGYGVDGTGVTSCTQPEGTAAASGDCDDGDTAYNPGAVEEDCDDPNDYNCDGSTGYADGDGDGWAACEECDDADAEENPDKVEICDGDDDDCDGEIDEDDAADASTWYADSDGDGFGDGAVGVTACSAPEGYVADGTDCDDTNDAAYPGRAEECDGDDNDCDGEIDEDDAVDAGTWYQDADSDGFGDPDEAVTACDPGDGYSLDGTDCDDGDSAANPDADEICDGDDDDCDGEIDEDDAVDQSTWYQDGDSDGYGADDTSVVSCEAPEGYSGLGGDCDDADTAYNPGATEDDCADPNDYNCDGSVGYLDGDGDGWAACEECDDDEGSIFPGADELCDDVDNDCDGDVDEAGAAGSGTWYADGDGDGYGDASDSVDACEAPAGYVASSTDCDDTDDEIHPGGAEVCDGEDNDCDSEIDEDSAFDASTWYADDDSDGYGDASSSTEACEAPAGYVADDNDCDDTDGSVNPDALEYCDDEDDDCDGSVDEDAEDATAWYADLDVDTYGDASVVTYACDRPSKTRKRSGDCDDTDSSINPDATEECDGVDNDCDGDIDEAGAEGSTTWYADEDEDGYGDDTVSSEGCDAPAGYIDVDGDCDDGDADVNPGEDEVCNEIDDDCDGIIDGAGADGVSTWYTDADRDGYGDPDTATVACDAPSGTVSNGDDCDDSLSSVNPGEDEVCDELDNDCDGEVDEDAIDMGTWYTDDDEDGYGVDDSEVVACDAPDGAVPLGGDCDDTDPALNPGETDVCDGIDNDCDGEMDEAAVEGHFLSSSDTTYGAVLNINPEDGSATEVVSLSTSVPVSSVAIGPDGTAYVHNGGTLYTYDACTGTLTAIGASGRGTICGLVFDNAGTLYGLDRNSRSLVSFDTATGVGTSIGALGFRIGTCGIAYDCTNDRIVGADATSGGLFTVDPVTGVAEDFVGSGLSLVSVGLEYDPRDQSFLLSTTAELYHVDYSTGDTELIGTVSPGSNIDDLTWYPECPAD